ncbi:uncharacterized protein spd-2 [Fopius arisanus]|uniref:Uncharacterized protein spd-2 n=1 Tax=Fopius arisanus TaxID=64838 RepID=A0A9R1T984_9HYME|nr:PREDICTED: uncharacterized protein LOC105267645 [Fopius arisanus]XP_011304936.1 PREDICTED: uncharacterized protein LOC105267645 [Fopius arisanus]
MENCIKMEFEKDSCRSPRTSGDNNQESFINMTILSTPKPQATSTVERRTFGSYPLDSSLRFRDSPGDDSTSNNTESSLGLVNDISSRSIIDEECSTPPLNRHETERKLARELIQKVNNRFTNTTLDPNKENNLNSPNLSDNTPSTLTNSLDPFSPQRDHTLLSSSVPKSSITSVVFEPTEITGRSSEKSRSPNTSPSQFKNDGFSFNSTAAELMAKFANEDFLSGSKLNSQLSADESSWNQNLEPIRSTERERLNFSCFSGIIGDMDLSLESCVGRRVSVGEFFGRKCEPIGQLSATEGFDRPAFGFNIRSPKRLTKPGALVNLTTMTDSSKSSEPQSQTNDNPVEKFYTTCTASCIDDTRDEDDEEPLISLSGIAKALDSNDETPRRLVDQLLRVKKKEKEQKERKPLENGNCTSGTYTLQSARCSLPAFNLETPQSSRKLSLDSKTLNSNVSTNNPSASTWSLPLSNSFEQDHKSPDKFIQNAEIQSPGIPKVDSTPDPAMILTPPSPFCSKESLKQLINQQIPPEYSSPGASENVKNSPISYIKSDRSIKKEINTSGQISSPKLNSLTLTNTSGIVNGGKDSPDKISLEKLDSAILKNPAERLTIGKNAEGLYKCILGVAREADIEMTNESNRWLVCSLHLLQIQGDKENIHLEIPDYTVLIKPGQSKIFKIVVKLLKMGGPVLAALSINCSDMTTRESSTKNHLMCFIPSDAQIDVIYPEGHQNTLNFSLNKEVTELPVVLENKYDTDVPLELAISNNKWDVFNMKISMTSNDLVDDNKPVTHLILKANDKCTLKIQYNQENMKQTLKNSNEQPKLLIRVHNEIKTGSILAEIPLIVEEMPNNVEKDTPVEITTVYSRCDTPQQQLMTSLPSSPHSTTSTTSARTSTSAGRSSPRSLSSGGTVAGDTIPIQSTYSSLSWTTVKVGKHEIKEFTIRNTSNNKIKLQATITDNDKSFKFLKERESSTSILVGLQKMESRTLSIIYSPLRTGASAGKITFVHYENKIKKSPGNVSGIKEREIRPSRVIMLYGCGGYAKVNINQAMKIMGAQMWLSLGQLNSAGTLTTTVQLENSGDLPAYAKIKLSPKAVYPTVATSWHVEPTEIILGPKQSQWITIDFKPRKEDIALLRGDVAEMGILTITHGDEPTRWRIRRLYKKSIETGQVNDKQTDVFRNVVDPICRIFPGEEQMPQLSIIRDAVQDLGILCRSVHRQVVTLMMDLNFDETVPIFTDDADESQMFQSLCSDTSVVSVHDEDSYIPSESLLERTLVAGRQRELDEEFSVTPASVTLNPPGSKDATVMITSASSTAQPFEAKLTNTEFLSVVPSGGMIPAKRGFLIKVQCKKNVDKGFQAVLQIFTSNERKDVKIHVVPKRY